MNYELKHIHGIPYYLDGTTVRIFDPTTGQTSIPAIGTYDTAANSITYFADWRDRVKPNLNAFHSTITAQERDKLRESIIKPTKQRKATRNPRKTTARTKDS